MFFLWIIFAVILCYSLLFSPWLVITETAIKGESVVPRETLEALLERKLSEKRFFVFPQRNLLLFPGEALQREWREAYPKFEHIEVERIFPHTMHVYLYEKPYIVRWCSGGPCFVSSSEGRAYSALQSEDPLYSSSLLTIIDKSALPIELGQPLDMRSYMDTYIALVQNLPREAGISIGHMGETPTRSAEELRIETNEGWYLFVSTIRPADHTIETLRRLLAEKITPEKRKDLLSIDLRTEGRAFIGFKTIVEEISTDSPPTKEEVKKDEKVKAKKKE